MNNLKTILQRIDGKGYKAYKDLTGKYLFDNFLLYVDYVQGDPFASPSQIRVRVDSSKNGFPKELFKTTTSIMALEDYVLRNLNHIIKKIAKGNRGTGKSGLIASQSCGQEILKRTGVVICPQYIEARLSFGLPAQGRRILAREAEKMFFGELPQIVEKSLFYSNLNIKELKMQIKIVEDQEYIRDNLDHRGLVAFIANDSILPRKSGISDKPMQSNKVVPFKSPQELEVTFTTPNSGQITGMGIPKGITIIVGGGYHGKSTLLEAIEKGVYNHIPGDGREFVISNKTASKIRAEDGRSIVDVNISPFINNLPHGQDTQKFSTENASGSTSQAANIIEAIELGSQVLLLDEDTSATNFMIRDERMQKLVAKEKEPITPFIDKVRQIYEDLGISSILVVGGTGDYFDVADTVIMMDEYIPKDVTAKAKEIAASYESKRIKEGGTSFGKVIKRIPNPESFNPKKGRKVKITAKGLHTIIFGTETIKLDSVEQLVDINQTAAIGDMLYYLSKNYFNKKTNLSEGIQLLLDKIEMEGLDIISSFYGQHPGYYALPRKIEIGAAINRIRTLKILDYNILE
jgi:predicted ABC-class ATPase